MLLCQRCFKVQKTCCQRSGHIVLTQGDVQRMSQACGRNDFVEYVACAKLTPDEIKSYNYDPNWLHYITLPGNVNRILKHDNEGNCVFLGKNGCQFSEDIRPFICRLFPYNYDEFGMIGFVYLENMWCPLHLLKDGETIESMLALPPEQAEAWRKQFYAELRAEYLEYHEESTLFKQDL